MGYLDKLCKREFFTGLLISSTVAAGIMSLTHLAVTMPGTVMVLFGGIALLYILKE